MKNSYQHKILFLLVSIVSILSSRTFAQNTFYGKVYYGISDAAFLEKEEMIGVISKDVDGFREFGFLVGKKISKKWAIETGLNSAVADIIFKPNPSMFPVQELTILPSSESFKMFSFPVLMRYSIFPFLFVNAGPLLDIQRSENPSYKQSGFGYLLGIGAEHYFKKVGFFVHPHFKRHSTIPFVSTNYNLTEFGLQFGLSYNF
ncbi:outer membrane beta-barrel protein [Shivajiella indica]|uniref:Outer membrane beta-barrel protein n=1 Tax=Shivajiella indica TaxID=872115 RepID=A0ABW5B7V4_9BACT